MLHVSDINRLARCQRMAVLSYQKRPDFSSRLHLIAPFADLWKEYFGLENIPSTKVGDSSQTSLDLLASYPALINARFSWKDLRVRIPLLIKNDTGYTAIYPYLSSAVRENEAFGMKINDLVAQKNGIQITSHQILYLNRSYVRQDTLDVHEMFETSDKLFNRRLRPSKSIEQLLQKEQIDLDELIASASKALQSLQDPIRCKACMNPDKCRFYEICFQDETLLDDSCLFLFSSSHKLQAAAQGLERICEIAPGALDGMAIQYAQYQASRHNGEFLDLAALESWLSDIQYPISYLDFEWDTFAFPPYPGMHPLDVLCFQYSLHIEQKDGSLTHTDFFQTRDCRVSFIESLLENVPDEGTILVYNMEGAEKLRLRQLAEQFPQYASRLEGIWTRMKDLSKPFENGIYYHNAQRGHYSLKNILPVFSDTFSYTNLEVANGLDAIQAYRSYDSQDAQGKEKILADLKKYCAMDTYAEYIVYHGLCKKIGKETEHA